MKIQNVVLTALAGLAVVATKETPPIELLRRRRLESEPELSESQSQSQSQSEPSEDDDSQVPKIPMCRTESFFSQPQIRLIDPNAVKLEDYIPLTLYQDSDGDAFGNPASSIVACMPLEGYVLNNGDCNDANATIHPDAEEICDGLDNNCDGRVDEDLTRETSCSVGVGADTCVSAGEERCEAGTWETAKTCVPRVGINIHTTFKNETSNMGISNLNQNDQDNLTSSFPDLFGLRGRTCWFNMTLPLELTSLKTTYAPTLLTNQLIHQFYNEETKVWTQTRCNINRNNVKYRYDPVQGQPTHAFETDCPEAEPYFQTLLNTSSFPRAFDKFDILIQTRVFAEYCPMPKGHDYTTGDVWYHLMRTDWSISASDTGGIGGNLRGRRGLQDPEPSEPSFGSNGVFMIINYIPPEILDVDSDYYAIFPGTKDLAMIQVRFMQCPKQGPCQSSLQGPRYELFIAQNQKSANPFRQKP